MSRCPAATPTPGPRGAARRCSATSIGHWSDSSTDGRAVISSFDLDASLGRIAEDLSQYYLIGYYTTNPRADGSYRRITVKVKRPGVEVRARPGYRALSAAEMKADASARAATPAVDPETASIRREVAALDMIRTDRTVRLDAGWSWRAASSGSGPEAATIWAAGEIDQQAGRMPEWQGGGTAVVSLMSSDGRTLAEQTVTLARGIRTFLASLTPEGGLQPGSCAVRLIVHPAAGALDSRDTINLVVPAGSGRLGVGRPMIERRGPFTGPRFVPTADARLRRQEIVRVNVPVAADVAFDRVTAEILDRNGQPLQIPVPVSDRADQAGRWFSAEAGLAPLARGDYAMRIRFENGADREFVLRAFRIVP